MKCVNTFKTREHASEARKRLTEKGIESRILVDTIDMRFGGLSTFDDVALVVPEERWKEAAAILGAPFRRAA